MRALLRRLAELALVAACALTAGALGLALAVALFGRRDRLGKADAIVVLGARVRPTGISPALRARVERAVELYCAGWAPWIVFSGGLGPHPPAESEVARAHALSLGVPEQACVEESASRTTAENARFTAALMRERGWTSALVVTDDFHLLRARQEFRRAGLEVHTCPSRREGRQLGIWHRMVWTSREALALLTRPGVLLARPPRRSEPSD